MNLMFSLKQTGVPIGGVLSGVIVPPLTLYAGWQAAFAVCAVLIAALALAIGVARRDAKTVLVPLHPAAASGRDPESGSQF